jgi:hypothetical protein
VPSLDTNNAQESDYADLDQTFGTEKKSTSTADSTVISGSKKSPSRPNLPDVSAIAHESDEYENSALYLSAADIFGGEIKDDDEDAEEYKNIQEKEEQGQSESPGDLSVDTDLDFGRYNDAEFNLSAIKEEEEDEVQAVLESAPVQEIVQDAVDAIVDLSVDTNYDFGKYTDAEFNLSAIQEEAEDEVQAVLESAPVQEIVQNTVDAIVDQFDIPESVPFSADKQEIIEKQAEKTKDLLSLSSTIQSRDLQDTIAKTDAAFKPGGDASSVFQFGSQPVITVNEAEIPRPLRRSQSRILNQSALKTTNSVANVSKTVEPRKEFLQNILQSRSATSLPEQAPPRTLKQLLQSVVNKYELGNEDTQTPLSLSSTIQSRDLQDTIAKTDAAFKPGGDAPLASQFGSQPVITVNEADMPKPLRKSRLRTSNQGAPSTTNSVANVPKTVEPRKEYLQNIIQSRSATSLPEQAAPRTPKQLLQSAVNRLKRGNEATKNPADYTPKSPMLKIFQQDRGPSPHAPLSGREEVEAYVQNLAKSVITQVRGNSARPPAVISPETQNTHPKAFKGISDAFRQLGYDEDNKKGQPKYIQQRRLYVPRNLAAYGEDPNFIDSIDREAMALAIRHRQKGTDPAQLFVTLNENQKKAYFGENIREFYGGDKPYISHPMYGKFLRDAMDDVRKNPGNNIFANTRYQNRYKRYDQMADDFMTYKAAVYDQDYPEEEQIAMYESYEDTIQAAVTMLNILQAARKDAEDIVHASKSPYKS